MSEGGGDHSWGRGCTRDSSSWTVGGLGGPRWAREYSAGFPAVVVEDRPGRASLWGLRRRPAHMQARRQRRPRQTPTMMPVTECTSKESGRGEGGQGSQGSQTGTSCGFLQRLTLQTHTRAGGPFLSHEQHNYFSLQLSAPWYIWNLWFLPTNLAFQ